MTICPGGCGNEAHEDGDACRPCLLGARTLNRLRIEQLKAELFEERQDANFYETLCDVTHETLWARHRRGSIDEMSKQIVAELAEMTKLRDEAVNNGLEIAGRLGILQVHVQYHASNCETCQLFLAESK